jgi:hypothetical protein
MITKLIKNINKYNKEKDINNDFEEYVMSIDETRANHLNSNLLAITKKTITFQNCNASLKRKKLFANLRGEKNIKASH